MKIFLLAVCLCGLAQALPHPEEEVPHPEEEVLEDEWTTEQPQEDEDDLVGAGEKKYSLGLLQPDEEDLIDEESVAFFHDAEEDLVGAPLSYNAVTLGLVSPVKNQGQCGSCAAFATAAAVETCFKKLTGVSVVVSDQLILDCGFGYEGAKGCDGAPLHSYAKWAADTKKMGRSAQFPYRSARGTCPASLPNARFGAMVNTAKYIYTGTEELLKSMVAERSIVIAGIFFDQQSLNNFNVFRGTGIFNGCTTGQPRPFGHAVVVVGYGSEGGQDYWLIKNSWGTFWGDKGFAKMRRGVGACGIGKAISVLDCVRSNVRGAAALDCEEGDASCHEGKEDGDAQDENAGEDA